MTIVVPHDIPRAPHRPNLHRFAYELDQGTGLLNVFQIDLQSGRYNPVGHVCRARRRREGWYGFPLGSDTATAMGSRHNVARALLKAVAS